MEKTVLVRIGELFLKGNNKRFFQNILNNNIRKSLFEIDCKILFENNRIIVANYEENIESEIISRVSKVFGIHSVSPAIKMDTNLEEIAKMAVEISPKQGKFRVTVNKADKRIDIRSLDIARDIGGFMLEKCEKLTVDLYNFDFEVNIDIRENGKTYIFYEKIMAVGGLPVGSSGKAMLLMSGGIDSPVAAYKIAQRGVEIHAVHYHSFPYTSEQAKQKVIDLAKKLAGFCGPIELLVVPFTEIQYAIKENCPIEYMITIMRRFMMKIAEKLAKRKGCEALITGESLGQVASQTMQSINVTNSVVKMPVFRPLIGNDKSEIIAIANKIDTYETSILPYEDCCTVFLPKNPIIKPRLDYVEELEKALDIELLINNAMNNVETIVCQ